jgi:hypothetical protein
LNDEIKEDEIGRSGICSMHGCYEKFMPSFSLKRKGDELRRQTTCNNNNNIKTDHK